MRLRAQDVSWREIDGEMVLLDLRTSTYLTANRVGTLLLRLLSEHERTVDELADALVTEFEIPRSRAQADVEAFIADLRTRKLLAGVDPADDPT
ncbi:PqqD family protein [Ruania suaedae]|uniref:PqqD family protein n=1 Tax=Ruania suaedae TaxID=2897774 RepID=UPI001E511D7A|nr:PqqD family protein [Ruania suaedae]UFU02399.1 PqqD family protein [Ruania suaedae]